ncbi:MAG: hypothetical protein ACE5GK_05295 [Nitrospiria bacterium]
MKRSFLILLPLFLLLNACAGLDFSHVDPAAEAFHPKRIAILPETVGPHESARDVVGVAVAKVLAEQGWFEDVVDGTVIKTQTQSSPDLAKEMMGYIQQINTLGVSDPEKAAKLGERLQTDAFFLTYVTSWGYGRKEGSKVCRVGLGVKLIDASKGTVIWKANHELVEDYWVFKPKIQNVANDLLKMMIKEMPH